MWASRGAEACASTDAEETWPRAIPAWLGSLARPETAWIGKSCKYRPNPNRLEMAARLIKTLRKDTKVTDHSSLSLHTPARDKPANGIKIKRFTKTRVPEYHA
jgi:hypothetical protein